MDNSSNLRGTMRRMLIPLIAVCGILSAGGAIFTHAQTSEAQDAAGGSPPYVMPKSGPFSPDEI